MGKFETKVGKKLWKVLKGQEKKIGENIFEKLGKVIESWHKCKKNELNKRLTKVENKSLDQ